MELKSSIIIFKSPFPGAMVPCTIYRYHNIENILRLRSAFRTKYTQRIRSFKQVSPYFNRNLRFLVHFSTILDERGISTNCRLYLFVITSRAIVLWWRRAGKFKQISGNSVAALDHCLCFKSRISLAQSISI